MNAMLIRRRDDERWEVVESRDGRPPYRALTPPLNQRQASRAYDQLARRQQRQGRETTGDD